MERAWSSRGRILVSLERGLTSIVRLPKFILMKTAKKRKTWEKVEKRKGYKHAINYERQRNTVVFVAYISFTMDNIDNFQCIYK